MMLFSSFAFVFSIVVNVVDLLVFFCFFAFLPCLFDFVEFLRLYGFNIVKWKENHVALV
jgi:hypothetical protein